MMAAELTAQHSPPGTTTILPSELITPETAPPMTNGATVADELAVALENGPLEVAWCDDVPPDPNGTEPVFASGIPPGDACADTPKKYDGEEVTPPVGEKVNVWVTS
jgi:hypothetical protein